MSQVLKLCLLTTKMITLIKHGSGCFIARCSAAPGEDDCNRFAYVNNDASMSKVVVVENAVQIRMNVTGKVYNVYQQTNKHHPAPN